MFKKLCILLSAVPLFVSEFAKAAEPWMAEVNVKEAGPHLKIAPKKLVYDLSWNGTIRSGHITFEIDKPGQKKNLFVGHIYGGSAGVARGLFNYDTNMVAYLSRKNYKPVSFIGDDIAKKETIKTTNRYSPTSVACTEVTTITKSKTSTTNSTTFTYPNTFDLVSAMLYIRSYELKQGETRVLVTHPFKTPYLVKATVIGREKYLGRDCIKLDVKLQKIGPDMKLGSYKKLKNATLWITDDAERLPIELRAKVFIGDVRMTLTNAANL